MTIDSVKNQVKQIVVAIPNFSAVKLSLTASAAFAEWLFGWQNLSSVKMMLVLIAFDLITAIGAEFRNGNQIESRKALKTVTKTVVYGIMIAASHLTGSIIGAPFIVGAAIAFLAVTEFISILENIGKMGYDIPNKLLNRLSDMKE